MKKVSQIITVSKDPGTLSLRRMTQADEGFSTRLTAEKAQGVADWALDPLTTATVLVLQFDLLNGHFLMSF